MGTQTGYEFLLMDGGQSRALPFPDTQFLIGSGAECHVRLPATMVQPKHAEVLVTPGGRVLLTDLTGKGLTWVNGAAVNQAQLSPGALIRLGRLELMLQAQSKPDLPTDLSRDPLEATAARPTPFREQSGAPAASPAAGLGRTLAPGTTIDDRYVIVSKIAAGGMGEVYKAKHIELNKQMAIKVMRPELSQDGEFVARFKREAIATSGIGQINIVDISDFGRTDDGRFYFVMEFLDGMTLASVVHREGPQRVDRVLNIALQVARALAAAHSLGVVHRDLKPENIMLLQKPGQRDFVKVVDFGVAKLPQVDGAKGYTAMGMVVGTPQYMSPEQAKAIPVDHRSDIYSLGLILYELLSGKPTFDAETPSIMMVKQVTEPPPPLEVGDEGAHELAQLVMKMLAKAPGDRPQTMEEVIVALDGMVSARKAPSSPRSVSVAQVSGRLAAVVATPVPPPEGPVRTSGARTASVSSPGTRSTPTRSAPTETEPVGPSAENDLSAAGLKGRSRVPLFLGVGAVVVVLLVVGGLAMRGGGTAPLDEKKPVVEAPPPPPQDKAVAEPEKTPPPVDSPSVNLVFRSTPVGAEVYEGDVMLGKTPLTLSRPGAAMAELRFEHPGYRSLTRKFAFTQDDELDVTLQREARGEGRPEGRSPHGKPDPRAPGADEKPDTVKGGEVKRPEDKPTLIDPYAEDKKAKTKTPELKDGVY